MIEATVTGVLAGDIDPVELTERALARAAEVTGLNAIVHLDPEGARTAAARVHRGSLAGIPLLVKEIMPVKGMPFRCGSGVLPGDVSAADADVVRRARAEGAVIIGLAHSHEFAYGCTGASNVAGPCRNPHDPARMTGGSSSGSAAAVAAGVVPLALGTDTAGSVRIPAAFCGVVGALPQRGTLPADGVFPLSRTLDRVGVLTTSVADARYAVAAISGAADLAREPVANPTLGTVADPDLLDCAPEVSDAYAHALEVFAEAGATLVEVQPPSWRHLAEIAYDLQGPEAAAQHHGLGNIEDYQPDVQRRLRAAAEVPGWRYVRARYHIEGAELDLGYTLSTVDAMILPTVPILAPPLDDRQAEVASGWVSIRELVLRNNRPLNVTGYPALSVPIPSPSRLPVGLQLIATGNRKAFDVAEWVERAVRSAG
jgi:Asp-tRNA(Asn)/Glu-tRNA(Gln) amidotransferase A subunit family amidase